MDIIAKHIEIENLLIKYKASLQCQKDLVI